MYFIRCLGGRYFMGFTIFNYSSVRSKEQYPGIHRPVQVINKQKHVAGSCNVIQSGLLSYANNGSIYSTGVTGKQGQVLLAYIQVLCNKNIIIHI